MKPATSSTSSFTQAQRSKGRPIRCNSDQLLFCDARAADHRLCAGEFREGFGKFFFLRRIENQITMAAGTRRCEFRPSVICDADDAGAREFEEAFLRMHCV